MNELQLLLKSLLSLPTWVLVLLYVLLGSVAVSIAGYFSLFHALITAAIVLLIGILLLLYVTILRWARRRQEQELQQKLTAPPRPELLDPDLPLRIQELHKTFAEGVKKLNDHGIPTNELPWFLLLGPPSSGKSQLILQSGLELVSEIHPHRQPIGSSSALQWWVTRQAILIEIPGFYLRNTQDQSIPAEWLELLRLLQNNRSLPINGIIYLYSMADLLNQPDDLTRSHGITLARILDSLRQRIQLRLPVFILISQSDSLPGFAEFFSEITEPKLRNQIFGWSNPLPLQAPLRLDLAATYFHQISDRLRNRRLYNLHNPLPRSTSHSRIEEVAPWFSLPNRIPETWQKIQILIQEAFASHRSADAPHFLRGIYLTSALPPIQDDQELPPHSIPPAPSKPSPAHQPPPFQPIPQIPFFANTAPSSPLPPQPPPPPPPPPLLPDQNSLHHPKPHKPSPKTNPPYKKTLLKITLSSFSTSSSIKSSEKIPLSPTSAPPLGNATSATSQLSPSPSSCFSPSSPTLFTPSFKSNPPLPNKINSGH
ncbi:MAG: hypothetical protein N2035_08120 [Chthoniobacterales bacterium]|nr:hypothetical protein [Chthoniobacterales bacterium]